MKEILLALEPTLHRMLIRLALAIGLILLSAQVALLLRLNTTNNGILVALASVPAIGLVLVELCGGEAQRHRKLTQQEISRRVREISNLIGAAEMPTSVGRAMLSTRLDPDVLLELVKEAVEFEHEFAETFPLNEEQLLYIFRRVVSLDSGPDQKELMFVLCTKPDVQQAARVLGLPEKEVRQFLIKHRALLTDIVKKARRSETLPQTTEQGE